MAGWNLCYRVMSSLDSSRIGSVWGTSLDFFIVVIEEVKPSNTRKIMKLRDLYILGIIFYISQHKFDLVVEKILIYNVLIGKAGQV
jgi:hypothetical protein